MEEYKLWADGTWCPIDEDHSDMSDDYMVVNYQTTFGELEDWIGFNNVSTFVQEIFE